MDVQSPRLTFHRLSRRRLFALQGKKDDPMTVLDEKLQVRGVVGLRVADCSVIPVLHDRHTQTPACGIGEKCADLIKET